MSISLKQLTKVRCRLIDKVTGQPVAGVVVSLSVGVDGAEHPLPISTLRSDATGYLSFDLKSLIDLGLDVVSGLYVSAPQLALKDFDLSGASAGYAGDNFAPTALQPSRSSSASQGRRKHLCIEFPIVVERPKPDDESGETVCRPVDLPAVQRPDPCDYALSPHSFVSSVKINAGGDCCESLMPSTLPVQEHLFYRVIVRAERGGASDAVTRSIKRAVEITGNLLPPPPKIRFADVLDYRQRWYAIGHSLGEIKYSLPLAPGESTQLAVIDWSRTDTASRLDSVTGKEDLSHWQKRDRTIEDTIDAGLKESQGGWSWAGGLSSGMAYDAKAYGQYTGNWAAGGGTSSSWGDRDLEADSLQELHDTISQSTAYTRSLNSTVIVQASQAELNNVQTRRVANHNHCHALTIQYYEVLRHFRLSTEFVGRRRAALIPFSTFSFSRGVAIRFRTILEPALLDRSVLAFFDALVRLDLDLYPDQTRTGAATGPTYYTGTLAGLVVDAQDFPMYPKIGAQGASMLIEKGSTVHIAARAQAGGITFPISGQPNARYDVDGQRGAPAPDDGRWPMPGAPSFSLLARIGPDFYPVGKDDTFEARNEGVLSLWFNDASPGDNSGTATASVSVSAPRESVAPNEGKMPEKIEDPKEVDKIKEAFLLKHLNANSGYYNRAIWFLMDPVERRLYLEMALGHDSELLSAIDDKPIAVSGNHVAFVYDGPLPSGADDAVGPEPLESIVTLPTRGLFAEAQLGHCNSCEKRDVTRMWNWNEMTTEEPPVITGVEPGPGGQIPAITPMQLPSNVIQIAPTPAAPDPVGLAAALKLLGTPDIFRDMSGLDEASTILGKLVDGTVSTLAGMVNAAGQAKQKVDAARAGQWSPAADGASARAGASGASGLSATDLADRFSLLPEIKNFAKEIGLSDADTRQLALDQIYGTNPAARAAVTTATFVPNNPSRAVAWLDLIRFRPPEAVSSAIAARGLGEQRIEDGRGALNLDWYPVIIDRLPNKPGTVTRFTEQELFDYVRKNFPSFLQVYPRTGKAASLETYEANDGVAWASQDPLGAVLKFTIDPNPAPMWLDGMPNSFVLTELGLVACTEYVADTVTADFHWNFTTLRGPVPIGFHPVSGTRQFGLGKSQDGLTFYVRAADRPTTVFEQGAGPVLIRGQEEYWETFRTKLVLFVTSLAGIARSGERQSLQFDWDQVRSFVATGTQA